MIYNFQTGPNGFKGGKKKKAPVFISSPPYGHIPNNASVSAYMRVVLHWLPVSKRILYRIVALVCRSVTGCARSYLSDLCRSVSDLAARRALRSSARIYCIGLSSFYWETSVEKPLYSNT